MTITRSDDHHRLLPVICARRPPREPADITVDSSPAWPVASLARRARTVRSTAARAELCPNRTIPRRRALEPGNTRPLRSSRPRRAHVSRIESQAACHNVTLGYPSKARQRSVPALGNSRPAHNHRLLTHRLSELRGEPAPPTPFSTGFADRALTTSYRRNAGPA